MWIIVSPRDDVSTTTAHSVTAAATLIPVTLSRTRDVYLLFRPSYVRRVSHKTVRPFFGDDTACYEIRSMPIRTRATSSASDKPDGGGASRISLLNPRNSYRRRDGQILLFYYFLPHVPVYCCGILLLFYDVSIIRFYDEHVLRWAAQWGRKVLRDRCMRAPYTRTRTVPATVTHLFVRENQFIRSRRAHESHLTNARDRRTVNTW